MMSRDIRLNIYIAPDISRDTQCNIYSSADVHVIVNTVAKNTRLVRTELDERLATTALDGPIKAFNARLATLHTRLVRAELDERLAKTALDDSNRQYARKQQQ